ncbi:MAG: type III-B CRISPR module-associated protein Cmr3, partial [Deltaproteobacteria bacterium]
MTTEWIQLEPIDVVSFRGNHLFAGSAHGAALMPPWPSVFSGALRSRMLVDAGVDPHAFARGKAGDARVEQVLGSPDEPGSFGVVAVGIRAVVPPLTEDGERDRARAVTDVWFPAPADLLVVDDEVGRLFAEPMRPVPFDALRARGSAPLSHVPVARMGGRRKPATGAFIGARGLAMHLRGERPAGEHLCRSSDLWKRQTRVGIGLDAGTRSVEEGLLYSADAICLAPASDPTRDACGAFVVGTRGGGDLLPRGGLVRLGADGRAARVAPCEAGHLAALSHPGAIDRRFRVVLATPGVFGGGWRPPGIGDDNVLEHRSMRARLVCAAVGRAGVVSGWDLANWRPKLAERVVAAGSVYWFEVEEGDPAEALADLGENGWWAVMDDQHRARWATRRAEGF